MDTCWFIFCRTDLGAALLILWSPKEIQVRELKRTTMHSFRLKFSLAFWSANKSPSPSPSLPLWACDSKHRSHLSGPPVPSCPFQEICFGLPGVYGKMAGGFGENLVKNIAVVRQGNISILLPFSPLTCLYTHFFPPWEMQFANQFLLSCL